MLPEWNQKKGGLWEDIIIVVVSIELYLKENITFNYEYITLWDSILCLIWLYYWINSSALGGNIQGPNDLQVSELRNRITYSMNHTQVKYVINGFNLDI